MDFRFPTHEIARNLCDIYIVTHENVLVMHRICVGSCPELAAAEVLRTLAQFTTSQVHIDYSSVQIIKIE